MSETGQEKVVRNLSFWKTKKGEKLFGEILEEWVELNKQNNTGSIKAYNHSQSKKVDINGKATHN
jgi:hypothetical protein